MKYQCLPYIMRFKKKSLREFALANQSTTKIKCATMRNIEQFESDFPDIAAKYFDMKYEDYLK